MGYNLFQRRPAGESRTSEFAATIALPADGFAETRAATTLPGTRPAVPPVPALAAAAPTAAQAGAGEGPSSDLVSDFIDDSLPATPDSHTEQRPTVSHIGRYAIKGPLGEGGLGQVHEAWDPLLSRTVAVKTLQFNIDAPARVSLDRLFLNEARAAAGLNHPNIVIVHDAGLSAHGVYIAMERLHGRDLRQALAGGWSPRPQQAAQLVRRVADALAYAHSRGVVHCDIKPGNIFITRHGKPKVLDFGIARVAHRSVLPAPDGPVMGSPHYLAPEQLLGGTVDARTDIHALGVVFYELLTGRKAFGGDTLEQITSAVLANHPAPAHELRHGVPRELSDIAAKAMARDSADRYASAADMALALRRWAESQPAADARATPAHTGRTGTASRRRGVVLGWMLAGALASALALGAALRSTDSSATATPAQPGAGAPPMAAAPNAAFTLPPALQPADPSAAPAPTAAEPDGAAPGTLPGNPSGTAPAATPATPAAAPLAQAAATRTTAAPAARPLPPKPRVVPAPAREGRSATTTAAAAPPATGAVQLAISPWGQVEVDGTPVGTTPPLTRLTLTEGTHTVTVRNEDFPPHTASVQVTADKPVTVRHRFGQ